MNYRCIENNADVKTSDHKKMVSVQYMARSSTRSRRICRTFEKEAAPIMLTLTEIQYQVIGGPFTMYTDHKALRSSFRNVVVYGKLARRLTIMAE